MRQYEKVHVSQAGPGTRRVGNALVIIVLAVIAMVAIGSMTSTDDWTRGYEPCATEDSAGPCYWDADEQGNGQGRSFVVEPAGDLAENDDDTIIYQD